MIIMQGKIGSICVHFLADILTKIAMFDIQLALKREVKNEKEWVVIETI